MLWKTVFWALQEIRHNGLRSSLTILGAAIGVAAVITIVTLGNGAITQVTAEISTLSSNLLQVRPLQTPYEASGKHLKIEKLKIVDENDNSIVRDMGKIMSTVADTTRVIITLLGAVAVVMVGGLGVMNIMLTSATERMREIDIQLDFRALEREALMPFLAEAVVLSCFGGLIGIVIGLSTARICTGFLRLPFIFKPDIVFAALLFSAAAGLLFSCFIAIKTARLKLVEALRHE